MDKKLLYRESDNGDRLLGHSVLVDVEVLDTLKYLFKSLSGPLEAWGTFGVVEQERAF